MLAVSPGWDESSMPTALRAMAAGGLILLALLGGSSCWVTSHFQDPFESGGLSQWTDQFGPVGASRGAARNGSWGLRVDASAGVASSARVKRSFASPTPGSSFRVAFDVRFVGPLSFDAEGQILMPIAMLRLSDSGSLSGAEILLRAVNLGSADAPDLRWELLSLPDSGVPYVRTPVSSELPPIRPGRWARVELVHIAATPGASDGQLQLFLDSDPYPALDLRGLDTSQQTQLHEVRLGIVGTVQGGSFRGTIDFDDYEAKPMFAWGDSFEAGGTSRWGGLTDAAGVATVSPAAASPEGGSAGLLVNASGLSGTAGVLAPFGESARRMLFEFDFEAAAGLRLPRVAAPVPYFGVFSADFALDGGSDVLLGIANVAPIGAAEDLRWVLRVREDGLCCRETPMDDSAPRVLLGEWAHVRIETLAAHSNASDGEVRVFIGDDPFPRLVLTGLATSQQRTLREVGLGVAQAPTDSLLDGSLAWDAFSVRALSRALPVPPDTILSQDSALYRVLLWKDFDPGVDFHAPQPVVIEGGEAELDANGERVHPEARVRVLRSLVGEETEWRIEVTPTPGSGHGVYRVEFPRLVANPIAGEGSERLLVPHGIGRAILDPLHEPERLLPGSTPIGKRAVWYGTYGSSFQAMQLMLYEKGGRGVLVYTKDPELRIKDFEFSSDTAPDYYGPGRRIAVHHYPGLTGQPGVGWQSPYPVVTRPYATGWSDALRHYRSWALQQSWTSGGPLIGRIRAGDLPGWYLRNALWATAITDQHLPLVDRILALFAPVEPPVEIGLFLTNWQAHASLVEKLPEFFPPKSHTQSLAAGGSGCPDDCWYFDFLDRQQGSRLHVFPYTNVHVAERDASGAPRVPSLRLRDGSSFATSTIVAQALPGLFAEPYLQPGGENDQLPLCRAQGRWRDYFADLGRRNLASHALLDFDAEFGFYGSDGHYLDQMAPGSVYPCFALDHDHPPGFGAHGAQGLREMAAAARPTRGVLMGEGIFEGFADVVQESYATDPPWSEVDEVVPLYPAVYQGYTALHEWPFHLPEVLPFYNLRRDVMSALAMPFHLGLKPGSFTGVATWLKLSNDDGCARPDICALLVELAQVAVRTMDVRAYGERLADPVVDAPGSQVASWCVDKTCATRRSVRRPVVEASLWRSLEDPQRTLLLLSNSGPYVRSVRVAAEGLSPGTELTDVLTGSRIVYDPAQPIAVPGIRWLALTTKPLDDPDGDFVDDRSADNCPGVFDPTQRDSDGDGSGDACDTP